MRLNPIAEVNGTLACGTLLVDQSMTERGQVDLITFTGTAEQIIDLTLMRASGLAGVRVAERLFAPSGVAVGGTFFGDSQTTFTLSDDGT